MSYYENDKDGRPVLKHKTKQVTQVAPKADTADDAKTETPEPEDKPKATGSRKTRKSGDKK